MRATVLNDLIYMGSDRKGLPAYLQKLRGFKVRQVSQRSELALFLERSQQRSLVLIEMSYASILGIQSFLSLLPPGSSNYFVFICGSIDPQVFQFLMNKKNFVLLRSDEKDRIPELAAHWQQGKPLFSRRTSRQNIQVPVMVKKSAFSATSPTGTGIMTLKEGHMCDFSAGGAKVSLRTTSLKQKDFISLMYLSDQGQWVSVEAQLRWIQDGAEGEQILGLQFLAMSA